MSNLSDIASIYQGIIKSIQRFTIHRALIIITIILASGSCRSLINKLPPPIIDLKRNMQYIKGGTFIMGCKEGRDIDCYDSEKPAHEVTLNHFRLGKYEVTQAQWVAVMQNNPSHQKNCPNCPVDRVSWNDIQVFIQKLNDLTGKHFRLPTEAEWEYAARGGEHKENYKYCGSDDIDEVAVYNTNIANVGSKKPNSLGLYDMSGNVREWCNDFYEEYSNAKRTNPKGSKTGKNRVLRGGSDYCNIGYCRISHRYDFNSDYINNRYGFRLAGM